MTTLYFGPPPHMDVVRNVFHDVVPGPAAVSPAYPTVLIGVGAEGCAALAEVLAVASQQMHRGLRGVVLVDPVAPYAARRRVHVAQGHGPECYVDEIPLGPLERFRRIAEACRNGEPWADGEPSRLRFVIACSPVAQRCAECAANTVPGWVSVAFSRAHQPCCACGGTGRMLSSAEVAHELSGGTTVPRGGLWLGRLWSSGGMSVMTYADRGKLALHAAVAHLAALLADCGTEEAR